MKIPLQLFLVISIVCFGFSILTEAVELENSGKHQLWVSFGQNHYLDSEDYSFSLTPYQSVLDAGQEVTQYNSFELKDRESWSVGYSYHFNEHWSLQADLMHARTKMQGSTTSIDFSYFYHFYNYWESAWGRLVEIEETVENPRHPHGSYDRYEIGVSLVYFFNIKKFQTSLYGGISYSSLSNGTIDDFYFRSDSLGSRSLRHQSTAFLQTNLNDSTRLGYRLGARLAYPMTPRLKLFVDVSLRGYEENRVKLELFDTEAEYKDWITSDLDRVKELVQLEPFLLDARMVAYQIGVSIDL